MDILIPEGAQASCWPDLRGASAEEAVQSVGVWYHTIELSEDLTTDGVYDMRPYLGEYAMPSLEGRSLLDVGSSNGFFSLQWESLGAHVTAVDLPSYKDHDFPAWYLERRLAEMSPEELSRIDWNQLHGGFAVASALRNSKVQKKLMSIYELESLGRSRFDVVFCSNVLVHTRDPLLALSGMFQTAKSGSQLVLATPIVDQEVNGALPANFMGLYDQPAFWVPTLETLRAWCRFAGWERVETIGSFFCKRVGGDRQGDQVGVVHAWKA